MAAHTTVSKKTKVAKTSATRAEQSIKKEEAVVGAAAHDKAPQRQLHLSSRVFGIILGITGSIGLAASIELTLDKIRVLEDPTFQPVCNFNPIFSCKSVMVSNQAELMGIPNTIFGIIGFSMVIAIGAALIAGGKFHKRFWQLWMLGMLGGLVMMSYLIFQSIYRLGTLCVFCMTTWATLLPLIWYSVLWGLQNRYIPVPARLAGVVRFVRREHLTLLIAVYIAIAFLIVNHFWYYFKTL